MFAGDELEGKAAVVGRWSDTQTWSVWEDSKLACKRMFDWGFRLPCQPRWLSCGNRSAMWGTTVAMMVLSGAIRKAECKSVESK